VGTGQIVLTRYFRLELRLLGNLNRCSNEFSRPSKLITVPK